MGNHKVGLALGIGLCILFLGFDGAWGAEKVAFVNMGKLFDNYEKTIQEDKALAEKGTQKTTEREALVQEIRRLKDELAILSDENKEERQMVIDEKLRGLQDFDRSVRVQLNQERKRVFRDVLKDIEGVIADYGKKKDYQFIFHDSALLFKDEKLDVTDEILTELNNRFRQEKKEAT